MEGAIMCLKMTSSDGCMMPHPNTAANLNPQGKKKGGYNKSVNPLANYLLESHRKRYKETASY
jgi:hypothetical protein